jgi:hypothetical protein
METRIRRYFTFRKPKSNPSQVNRTADDLDLISVPYESTSRGRAPVLSSGLRKTDTLRTKDDLDTFAVQTFPYESAVAGTPPVFGATPIKGNGPVKLQTSRRLSSGELLVTTQDHQRTLSDIREGEYIVGRKDPKRGSKTISIKLPLQSSVSSPRASLALAPPLSSPSSAQSLRHPRKKYVSGPIPVDRDVEMVEIPAPEILPRNPYYRDSSLTKSYILGPTEIPLPSSPGRPPSSRTSLLSRGEEQNATIQALWKAEYARLVAIYGQDGVDRNIAELNKDHFSSFPVKRASFDNNARKLGSTPGGTPQPHADTVIPPLSRSPRGSILQELPLVDNASEYSSHKVPSLLSSEESSSSYTKRTSLFEAEVPTTREEVSRIVENMRKNYLKALEAKAEEKPKTKRPKKSRQRASYTHTSVPAASAPVKSAKGASQSWHASTVPNNAPKQEKQTKRRPNSKSKNPRDSTMSSVKTTASKSSLKTKPPLHRADSTTLGSFFGSKKDHPRTPSPARTFKASRPEQSPKTGQTHDVRPPTTEPATTSAASADNIAPEIDDFDIFYQDLTRDINPTPSNLKPAIPAIVVRHNEGLPAGPGDSAPPPPDIDWTPRSRGVLTAV